MSENRCLFCGDIIPEGLQICRNCEKIYSDYGREAHRGEISHRKGDLSREGKQVHQNKRKRNRERFRGIREGNEKMESALESVLQDILAVRNGMDENGIRTLLIFGEQAGHEQILLVGSYGKLKSMAEELGEKIEQEFWKNGVRYWFYHGSFKFVDVEGGRVDEK